MNKELLDRVAKLLALSDEQYNDSEHERASAAKAAESLMLRHGISRDDLTRSKMTTRLWHSRFKRAPTWFHFIVVAACDFAGCAYCYSAGEKTRFYIVGLPEDVDNVVYLTEVLDRQIDAAAKRYRQARHAKGLRTSRAQSNDFKRGMTTSISLRFNELTKRVLSHKGDQSHALVPVDRREAAKRHVETALRPTGPGAKPRGLIDSFSYHRGRDAGEHVNVNPAINNAPEKRTKRLLS